MSARRIGNDERAGHDGSRSALEAAVPGGADPLVGARGGAAGSRIRGEQSLGAVPALRLGGADGAATADRPGVLFGFLDSHGRHVYYWTTTRTGTRSGTWCGCHLAEASRRTHRPICLSTFGGGTSATGNQLAFSRADPEGFTLTAIDLGPDGEMSEPRVLFRSERVMSPPFLSHRGDLAVVASAERSTMQHYTLLAFDTRTGERVAELWDGEGTSVEGGPFARRATENGDAQLAGTTNRSGFTRPLIWRPRSGERRDLRLDELDGDVAPLDWSPDGDRLLLLQTSRAQRRSGSTTSPATHSTSWPIRRDARLNLLWTRWRDLRDLGGRGPPDRVIALDPNGRTPPHGAGCRGDGRAGRCAR